MAKSRICSIEGCGKPHHCRGYCRRHYERVRKHSDPETCLKPRADSGSLQKFFQDIVLPYKGEVCLIWPFSRDEHGYAVMSAPAGTSRKVHRHACAAVNGPPPTPKHEAAHLCGRGHLGCCAPTHTAWKTRTENEDDRVKHGTDNRGTRQGRHKLKEHDVLAIRSLAGKMTQSKIAEQFGVSISSIRSIQRRKNWGWLE
jgi:hypothetical protein